MFNAIDLFIASTFFCVVMALVVWLRAKPSGKADKTESASGDKRIAASLTQAGHYAYAAASVVIGVLLGVAINGVVQLIFTGAWVAVFNIALLSAALGLIVLLHDRLGELIFPSGIRPVNNPKKPRKPPLVRHLGLPAGLVLGVVLAGLGFDDLILAAVK